MTKKKAYYARCMAIYGTHQEKRDLHLLQTILGYEVIQFPSQDELNGRKLAGEDVMETVFKELVHGADMLYFRALPDLKIPAGVHREIEWAQERGIPVLELPSRVTSRRLTIAETREYLHEVGQR